MGLEPLNHSCNPVLNYLRAAVIAEDYMLPDAIVDTSGHGTHTTIADAVASGAKVILIRAGTHTVTGDLSLSDQSIIGQSPKNTIINISGTIYMNETAAEYTETGTISLTHGSSAVSGAATAFTNVTGSDIWALFQDRVASKISNISNATSMTLEHNWSGPATDLAGADNPSVFKMQSNPSIGSLISNLTINHTASAAANLISITGIRNRIDNCILIGSLTNTTAAIRISVDSSSVALHNQISNTLIHGAATGILLENASFTQISNVHIAFTATAFVTLNAGSSNTRIVNCSFSSGDALGISIAANAPNTTIHACSFFYIDGDAISTDSKVIVTSCHCYRTSNFQLSSNADYSSVSHCHLEQVDYGIIAASDHTTISDNTIQEFSTGAIVSSGSDNILRSNIITSSVGTETYGILFSGPRTIISANSITVSNSYGITCLNTGDYSIIQGNFISGGSYAIRLTQTGTAGLDYVTITGNVCYNNGTDGIDAKGNYITITGNLIITSGQYGINIEDHVNLVTGNMVQNAAGEGIYVASNYNHIVGNYLNSCGTPAYTDAGSSNTIAHNLIN